MSYESQSREQHEFNMAVSYLNRLNEWFYRSFEYSTRLDAFNWYHTLVGLFRELSTEMKEKEINQWNEEIQKLNDMVVYNQRVCSQKKTLMIPKELWLQLHKFDLFLRKVLRESGLQAKIKEDYEFASDDLE